jgi:hypothetical protein
MISKSVILSCAGLVCFYLLAILQGYNYGTGDLDTYVPFAFYGFDKSIFLNDMLFETVNVHPVYIWQLMGKMLHFFPAEFLFKAAFLIEVAVLLFGITFFYRTFFGNNSGVFFVMAMLTITKTSAAMGVYGLNPYKYFHPGALAFGIFLITFALWSRKKWIAGGILSGLVFLFHPFTAIAIGTSFAFFALLNYKSTGFKHLSISAILMVIVASPALMPFFVKFFNHASQPFDFDFWLSLVKMRMAHSFFISQWVSDRFVHLGLAIFGIFIFKNHPAFKKLLPLVFTTVFLLIVMALGELLSSKFILQLQLARTSYLLFVIAIMFIADRVRKINLQNIQYTDIVWFFLTCFFCVFSFVERRKDVFATLMILLPVLFCFLLLMQKITNNNTINKFITSYIKNIKYLPFAFILFLVVMITAIYTGERLYKDGRLYDTSGTSQFDQLAVWVRDNIPKSKTIMTPIYLEGFRSYSLHPIYGTYKDGAPHNYCETTIFRWWEKMQDFGIEIKTDKSLLDSLYHKNALRIATKENIPYIVYEKRFEMENMDVLFENRVFAIAKITQ